MAHGTWRHWPLRTAGHTHTRPVPTTLLKSDREEEHVYKAVKLRSNTSNSASAQNIVMLESP